MKQIKIWRIKQIKIFPTKNFLLLLTFLSILLTLPFALAQTGCFTFPDSPLYCLDIGIDQALEECLNLGCNPADVFFKEQSCQDFNQHLECEKINCKSSCNFEFSGKCSAGAIPSGEDKQWCSPGCCQFIYGSGNNYCEFREKKWLCEVEAKNKGLTKFTFDTATPQTECIKICQGNRPITIPVKNETTLSSTAPAGSVSTASTQEVSEEGYFYLVIILAVIIIFLLGMFYFFFKKSLLIWKSPAETKKLNLPEEEIPVSFLERLFFKKRMEELKEKHAQKHKEKQREDFFTAAGLALEKEAETNVTRLQKLVQSSKRNKLLFPPKIKSSLPKENAVKRLKEMIQKKEK